MVRQAEDTLYSQLSDDEKTRFRAWANMPTARRISDARVKSWIGGGKALTAAARGAFDPGAFSSSRRGQLWPLYAQLRIP